MAPSCGAESAARISPRVQLQVQTYGWCHIPVAVNNFALGIQGNDIASGQFFPGQLPGVSQNITVIKPIGNVARDVFVPTLAGQHAAH